MGNARDRGTLIYAAMDDEGRLEVFDRDNIRSLYFDSGACQTSSRLDDPAALVLNYTRSMLAALLFQPLPQRILLIGLGGGALARFLLKHIPSAQIDCVEMRPTVVTLAQQYFHLPDTLRLNIHLGDGAEFLRTYAGVAFDLILVDAFDGTGIHPSVCTPEFYADCRRALRRAGVLSVNLWNTREAPCQPLLDTIESGFRGQILRLPVEQRANLIAICPDRPCSNQELKLLRSLAHALTERLDLDYRKLLRRLQHHNGAVLRRRGIPDAAELNRTTRR